MAATLYLGDLSLIVFGGGLLNAQQVCSITQPKTRGQVRLLQPNIIRTHSTVINTPFVRPPDSMVFVYNHSTLVRCLKGLLLCKRPRSRLRALMPDMCSSLGLWRRHLALMTRLLISQQASGVCCTEEKKEEEEEGEEEEEEEGEEEEEEEGEEEEEEEEREKRRRTECDEEE
ncbi:unnamed protein product [Boreogadus saida]